MSSPLPIEPKGKELTANISGQAKRELLSFPFTYISAARPPIRPKEKKETAEEKNVLEQAEEELLSFSFILSLPMSSPDCPLSQTDKRETAEGKYFGARHEATEELFSFG